MANEKILNTRIQLRYDSYEKWSENNPLLKAGEVAIVYLATTSAMAPGTDAQHPVLFKVGPGNFNDLPWASALAADVHGWAKKTESEFIDWVKTLVTVNDLSVYTKSEIDALLEANSTADKAYADSLASNYDAAGSASAAQAAAEKYADELNATMNTRVEALEAIDHDHANKAELDKIADGDVAKWNAVVADHLTSTDKTALESAIKEAKKAGTDANTNIEAYKVTNDARVLAVEEDVAEIVDATNGILAQAKSYSDGKLATAKTEISAEIDADVKVVADELAGYKTSNDAALAGVKATAEAAATKVYTDEELAKKVDKVTGKSLVDDAEITKLAGVSAGANKVEASEVNGNIKIDGVETVVYTHPEKHAISDVTGLQEALNGMQVKGDYAAEEHTHAASEITDLDATIKSYDYATKEEAQAMADGKNAAIEAAQAAANKAQGEVDALETYVGTFTASEGVDTVIKYIDAKTANIASDETVGALADRVKAIEDDYLIEADKTALSNAITAEKERAEGIEGGLETRLAAVEADYLKAADKTELAGLITAEETRAKGVEESLQTQINTIMSNPDAEGAINSINEFTQYVKDHGTIAEGFRTDIDKNKEDIAAEVERAGLAESALSGRIDTLEAIDHEAYIAADTALKNELTAEIAKKADASALASAVEALEGADSALSGRLDAVEALLGDGESSVADLIAEAVEEVKTDSSNKDAVVLAEAQKSVAALQTVVDTKANDADLAPVAKSGLIDDLEIGAETVLIFNCGGASI